MRLRTWIVLAIALASLFAWERTLARPSEADRAGAPIEWLVDKTRMQGRVVAAVSLAWPARSESLLYLRAKGRWRSREAFGAVADEAALRELVASLLEAQGVVRTSDPAHGAAYGFGAQDVLVIGLHGPRVLSDATRDVIDSFDVGTAFDDGARGRAFVRATGTQRVLEIDRSPKRVLDDARSSSLPPLLDTHVLAGCIDGTFRGFKAFVFERADGTSFSVASESAAGADSDIAWFVKRGDEKTRCADQRAEGFTHMLLNARYDAVAGPARTRELGLDSPLVKITITPFEGDVIELDVSALDSLREGWCWNKTTKVVCGIDEGIHAQLVADLAMFIDTTRPNPWETQLRK